MENYHQVSTTQSVILFKDASWVLNEVLNYQLSHWLEKHNKLSEPRVSFRFGLSCLDNLF